MVTSIYIKSNQQMRGRPCRKVFPFEGQGHKPELRTFALLCLNEEAYLKKDICYAIDKLQLM